MSDFNKTSPTREQIEQRAYEIYLERGGQHGSDVNDWLAAENELGASGVDRFDGSEATPQFFQQGDSVAADEKQTTDAEKMLEELYERSRATAAGSGN